MIALVGSEGQIGSALLRRLREAHPGWKVETPAWQALHENPIVETARVAEVGAGGWVDWVWASGLTDPRAGAASLMEANFEGPRRAIEAALRFQGQRFLTLGTVHELFPALVSANAYFESKKKLADWASGLRPAALHVRLHTVYSAEPRPHMFLGQIVSALAQREPFKMSSGEQLREYHHVDDVAASLVRLLEKRDWATEPGVAAVELSHGRPQRLRDLAQAVFHALGHEELLELGELSAASGENREVRFQASPPAWLGDPRDPVQGVVEAVRQRLRRR